MTTVTVCPQWASNWDVRSMSGADDTSYLVQFHRAEPASCSCPAYRYSGDYGQQSCKHIERVRRHGCFYSAATPSALANDWEQQEGIQLRSTAGAIASTPERCPGCGAHMITVLI